MSNNALVKRLSVIIVHSTFNERDTWLVNQYKAINIMSKRINQHEVCG